MIKNYNSNKSQEGFYSKKSGLAKNCWRYQLLSVLLPVFFLFIGSVSNAQTSAYSFAESTETYVAVGGTVTTATGDDGTHLALPIGFTFNFGGVDYTTFSVTTNGMIRLGGTAISSGWTNSLSNTAALRPLIAPFWDDNHANGGPVSYALSGTTPNQILEVGWHLINVGGSGATSATNKASYKLRIYETTNVIEFVYGSMASAGALSASIGINDMSSFLSVTNSATATVSSTTANNTISTLTNLVGKKFTFTPPLPCTDTPTGGTVSPALSSVCTGAAPGVRTVTGSSTGATGFTYQWEESTDGGDTFVNATGGTGATTISYTPPVFAGTDIQYRLKITCTPSGLSGYSTVSEVKGPVVPTTQASAIVATSGLTSTTLTWTNGNGGRRYVVVNTTNSFTDPVDSASVTVAGTVYTSGEQIVYDGTGSSVTVTGLTSGTYYARVYEYARCTGPVVNYYNVATATDNPKEFTGPINNDDCANAITLPSCSGSVQTVAGSTTGSTVDSNYQDCGATGTNATERGVWYKYIGDNSSVTITTCNAVGYDSRLTVYSGSCGTFTCVAGNDDAACAASGLRSEVNFNAVAGTDYYVFVHGYQSGTNLSATGNFILTLTCAPLCTPATLNDECSAPEAVAIGTPLTANNTCSSASLGVAVPTSGSGFATYYDSWYSFNSGSNTTLLFETTFTAPVAVGFAVYSGVCGALTQVGASSLTGNDLVLSTLTADTEYFVRVFSTSAGARGSFDLAISQLPTTTIDAADCGTTILEAFYDEFSAVPTAGAQEYTFQITDGTNTYTAISVDPNVTFADFGQANIVYGTTYNVSVRVRTAGTYGVYGTSCPITLTASPVTEMHYLCGGNLPEITSKVYFTWVPQATKYRFSVTNMTTMVEEFTEATERFFYMNTLANFAGNTVYSIKAQVELNGVYSDFGPACNLTTPALPTSKLRTAFCDITLASMGSNLYADYVNGATQYRFRVTNGANVQTYDRPDSRFVMSMLPSVMAGTTYDVDVAVFVNGTWGAYGAICTVTTPAAPTSKLRTAYCGITLASVNDNIYADYVNGATQYRFRITEGANVQTIDRPDSKFYMSMLASYPLATTFTVDVAVEVGGVFGPYGATCSITTPAGLPTTKLRDAYCGVTLAENANMYAQYVANATAYKFKVTQGANMEEYVGTSNMRFYLSALDMEILPGTAYQVEVASLIGDVWSAYGTACTVTTPSLGARPAAETTEKLVIKAFPNPFTDGFSLGLNLVSNTVTDIHIYDMSGKLLERKTLNSNELVRSGLGHQLAAGIYNVQLIQGDKVHNLKVVKK
ncbi:hypothetical protein J2X31_001882 [Flavobacterium arsenatis]|uniref:Ig-like domain-containing protein n=1 Tax=Flavobacterium arsenatis TaxID=1484332 RepID=A0ABU1TR33_9FLAO|nr:T9SS type A sorting domain-containing protein [Flavobacterium arsenatis]MDR6967868.1 hypothetical protein [Flavobacterium arsenatis]